MNVKKELKISHNVGIKFLFIEQLANYVSTTLLYLKFKRKNKYKNIETN